MADATSNIVGNYRPSDGQLRTLPMAAESIVRGAMVNMHTNTGHVGNAGDDTNSVFLGVALEEVDNSAGAGGDKVILVDVGGCEVKVNMLAGGWVAGAEVTAESNQEVDVAATTTNDVLVGRIIEASGDSPADVWVKTRPFGI